MKKVSLGSKKDFINVTNWVINGASVIIRNTTIDIQSPTHKVIGIAIPLSFTPTIIQALKRNIKDITILLPLLRQYYFSNDERSIVDGITQLAYTLECGIMNEVMYLFYHIKTDDLSIITMSIDRRIKDLTLDILKNNIDVVNDEQFEKHISFGHFANSKHNEDVQLILELIITRCPNYYKKLSKYLREDIKIKLKPQVTIAEYNL